MSQAHETETTEFNSIERDVDPSIPVDLAARNDSEVLGYEASSQGLDSRRPLGFSALAVGSLAERTGQHGVASTALSNERQRLDPTDRHEASSNRSSTEPSGQCNSTEIEEMICHLSQQILDEPMQHVLHP